MFFFKVVFSLSFILGNCWAGSGQQGCTTQLLSRFNHNNDELFGLINHISRSLAELAGGGDRAHVHGNHNLVYFIGDSPPKDLGGIIPNAKKPTTAADFWILRRELSSLHRFSEAGADEKIFSSDRISTLRPSNDINCGRQYDEQTHRLVSGCFNGLLNMALLSVLVLQPFPNKEAAVVSGAIRSLFSISQFIVDALHPYASNRAARWFSKINSFSAIANAAASSVVPSLGIWSVVDIVLTKYRNIKTAHLASLTTNDSSVLDRLERAFREHYERGVLQSGTFVWSLREGADHFLIIILTGDGNRVPQWHGAVWTEK